MTVILSFLVKSGFFGCECEMDGKWLCLLGK